MKLAIRGYIGKHKIFDERVEVPDNANDIDRLGNILGELHEFIGGVPHMVEIEFLDEADPLKRFFRFGTDPRQMIHPIAVKL